MTIIPDNSPINSCKSSSKSELPPKVNPNPITNRCLAAIKSALMAPFSRKVKRPKPSIPLFKVEQQNREKIRQTAKRIFDRKDYINTRQSWGDSAYFMFKRLLGLIGNFKWINNQSQIKEIDQEIKQITTHIEMLENKCFANETLDYLKEFDKELKATNIDFIRVVNQTKKLIELFPKTANNIKIKNDFGKSTENLKKQLNVLTRKINDKIWSFENKNPSNQSKADHKEIIEQPATRVIKVNEVLIPISPEDKSSQVSENEPPNELSSTNINPNTDLKQEQIVSKQEKTEETDDSEQIDKKNETPDQEIEENNTTVDLEVDGETILDASQSSEVNVEKFPEEYLKEVSEFDLTNDLTSLFSEEISESVRTAPISKKKTVSRLMRELNEQPFDESSGLNKNFLELGNELGLSNVFNGFNNHFILMSKLDTNETEETIKNTKDFQNKKINDLLKQVAEKEHEFPGITKSIARFLEPLHQRLNPQSPSLEVEWSEFCVNEAIKKDQKEKIVEFEDLLNKSQEPSENIDEVIDLYLSLTDLGIDLSRHKVQVEKLFEESFSDNLPLDASLVNIESSTMPGSEEFDIENRKRALKSMILKSDDLALNLIPDEIIKNIALRECSKRQGVIQPSNADKERWTFKGPNGNDLSLETLPFPDDEELDHYFPLEASGVSTDSLITYTDKKQMWAYFAHQFIIEKHPKYGDKENQEKLEKLLSRIIDNLWRQETIKTMLNRTQIKLNKNVNPSEARVALASSDSFDVSLGWSENGAIQIQHRIKHSLEVFLTSNDTAINLPIHASDKLVTTIPFEESLEVRDLEFEWFSGPYQEDTVDNLSTSNIERLVDQFISLPLESADKLTILAKLKKDCAHFHQYLFESSIGTIVNSFGKKTAEESLKIGTVNVELRNSIKRLEDLIKNAGENLLDVRDAFLIQFRAISDSQFYREENAKRLRGEDYDKNALNIIFKTAQAIYEESKITLLVAEVVKNAISDQPIDNSSHHARIRAEIKAMDKAGQGQMGQSWFSKNLGKFKGTVGYGFDPHLDLNLPFAWDDLEINGKGCHWLRMGTPTNDSYWGKTSINPEYKVYLDNLNSQGKNHLYFNLQRRKEGSEGRRTEELEKLSTSYKESYFIVTFDQDSKFYKQTEGDSQRAVLSDEFKETFCRKLLTTTGHYFFSKNLNVTTKIINSVLNDVHLLIFEGKKNLTKEERLDFIEIAYAFIALKLLKETKADSFQMSCKDAIDRGGKLNSLLDYLVASIRGHADNPEFLDKHSIKTNAPAFIAKTQGIIPARAERLVSALKRLEEKKGLLNLASLRHDYLGGAIENPFNSDEKKAFFESKANEIITSQLTEMKENGVVLTGDKFLNSCNIVVDDLTKGFPNPIICNYLKETMRSALQARLEERLPEFKAINQSFQERDLLIKKLSESCIPSLDLPEVKVGDTTWMANCLKEIETLKDKLGEKKFDESTYSHVQIALTNLNATCLDLIKTKKGSQEALKSLTCAISQLKESLKESNKPSTENPIENLKSKWKKEISAQYLSVAGSYFLQSWISSFTASFINRAKTPVDQLSSPSLSFYSELQKAISPLHVTQAIKEQATIEFLNQLKAGYKKMGVNYMLFDPLLILGMKEYLGEGAIKDIPLMTTIRDNYFTRMMSVEELIGLIQSSKRKHIKFI